MTDIEVVVSAITFGKASATVVDKPVIRVRSMDVLLAKCDTEQKKLETTTTNTQAKLKNSIISLILNTTVCPFKFCRFYICIYCPSRFVSMPELEQHVKLKHKHLTEMDVRKAITKVGTRDPVKVNVTEYGCKLCDDQIFHFEHLKHHLINKHNEPVDIYNDGVFLFNITNEFGCALCGIKLENYLFLCKHMNEHYDKFSCFQCGAVFASVFRLKRHQLSHEEGYYPCDECGKVFSNSESRQTHIQTVHMKMKRNKCMYCEASFKEYIQKQKHLFAAHGIKQREYKCTYCPKVFNKSSGMRSHERQIHVKGQAFPCELCEYNCYDKNKLRRHMICHTGERKYTCQFCGKSYARPSTLNGHVRIHNNDRRHKCEYCDKAFVQKCSLQGHIRTHHKDVQM